ncbi:MAG: DUF1127 domain-containing protein, partial [Rhodospirillaceae bacterium]|nr:DUF1127 domain-containing protein [Rhodospirillaceae bacterium]
GGGPTAPSLLRVMEKNMSSRVLPRQLQGIWLRRLGSLLHGLVLAHRQRRAVARLESLSDHMLRDIGINRSGIDRAVRYGRHDRSD